ncbi:MAG: sigma factor [Myxococcota bacterium]
MTEAIALAYASSVVAPRGVGDGVLEALDVLRARPAVSRGAERRALETLARYLRSLSRPGDGSMATLEDLRQEALIAAYRAAHGARATTEAQARAWVKVIYRHKLTDHHRRERHDLLRRRPRNADSERDELSSVAAEGLAPDARVLAREIAAGDDGEALGARYRDMVFDGVDAHLDRTSRTRRSHASAYRNAELAWAVRIEGRSQDELLAALPPSERPTRNTLQKWLQRGRDDVLLPALEGLLAVAEPDTAERRYLAAALAALRGSLRADAGKRRPERRVTPRVVSPAEHVTSVQYDDGHAVAARPPTGGAPDD